ncbi:thiamine diphosphokinase [Hoeflea sp.]|uniref:thiamine diphosphokinase n=1 Tax=Hoeflea sp. TaxID=1940281 RepID=UPI003B519F7D
MKPDLTFAILLGGELVPDDRVRSLVEGARAIAADGGMAHAAVLGLWPELWVGDFDSTPPEMLSRHRDVPRQAFPAEKNFTDGELAVEEAIDRGATRLILAGAFHGPRTDHAIYHLLHAVTLAEKGLQVVLTSGLEEARPLLPGSFEFALPAGSLFSVIALTNLEGLTLDGAKYPLEGIDIAFGASRTISNVATGPLRVGLKSGRAVLLCRPHDFSGQ